MNFKSLLIGSCAPCFAQARPKMSGGKMGLYAMFVTFSFMPLGFMQQVLLDVGAWLNLNGEAIYGTRPRKVVKMTDLNGNPVSYSEDDNKLVIKYHLPQQIRLT